MYKAPDRKTITMLKGLRTELIASKSLSLDNSYKDTTNILFEDGYNQGLDKAIKFVDKYLEGRGLFQIMSK